jgi:hypothetical protein
MCRVTPVQVCYQAPVHLLDCWYSRSPVHLDDHLAHHCNQVIDNTKQHQLTCLAQVHIF